MNKEYDRVVLTVPLPSEGLKAGDIGTVMHIHQGGAAYEVEFVILTSETTTVTTLLAAQLRPLARLDMAHAREFSVA